MSEWVHNICLSCWKKREPGRQPIMLKEQPIETCCFCGGVAENGIYVRQDPAALGCEGNHGQ